VVSPWVASVERGQELDEEQRVLLRLEPTDGEQLERPGPLQRRWCGDDVRLLDERDGHHVQPRPRRPVAAADPLADDGCGEASGGQAVDEVEYLDDAEDRQPAMGRDAPARVLDGVLPDAEHHPPAPHQREHGQEPAEDMRAEDPDNVHPVEIASERSDRPGDRAADAAEAPEVRVVG
jgi:hypothetical protein